MYKVRFTSAALGQLEKLDKPISEQVFKKLKWLSEHFDESVPIPLTGNLKDIYKLRVGDYRVLYTFDKGQKPSWSTLFNIGVKCIRQNRT